MEINTKAKLLTLEARSWKMDGREGVSKKARFLCEDQIIEFKLDEDGFSSLQGKQDKEGELTFSLTSRKEVLSTKFESFE